MNRVQIPVGREKALVQRNSHDHSRVVRPQYRHEMRGRIGAWTPLAFRANACALVRVRSGAATVCFFQQMPVQAGLRLITDYQIRLFMHLSLTPIIPIPLRQPSIIYSQEHKKMVYAFQQIMVQTGRKLITD